MRPYLELLRDVVDNGVDKPDRTGVGTRSVFGRQVRFDLNQGFPLLTTKRVHLKSVIHELLWFLSGSTDNNDLKARGVSIWDEWAAPSGDLGPIYGAQWRNWTCPDGRAIDQLAEVTATLQKRPHSRRLVVSAWNPADLPDESMSPQANVAAGRMALAPCHCLFQFNVEPMSLSQRVAWLKGNRAVELCEQGVEEHLVESILEREQVPVNRLSCQLYQRSADLFIGVGFNIPCYALLVHMMADQCGMAVGEFVHAFGDLHIYRNHLTDDIVFAQLAREPRPLPRLRLLRRPPSLFDYQYEDIEISGYDPYPAIRAPIAI